METGIIIIALLIMVGVPAFLAYLIGLFAYKRMVKAGNDKARRNRIVIFAVSLALLLACVVLLMLYSPGFER